MNSTKETMWQGNWIWGEGEASPRNEWHCFRRSFDWQEDAAGEARLSITADSRYVLYVNGVLVGRGPVRSWPQALAYDTYDVAHLLKPNQRNTIAVLVLHFGVSTFYYLRGRGGLLTQLERKCGDRFEPVVWTDSDWRTTRYAMQNPRTQRMSCQHGYAEWIDARLEDAGWVEPAFDDRGWGRARELGPVGMAPWTSLVPRDIPLLTEEPEQPVRVVSLSRVQPVSWTTTVDMRQHMLPDCAEHANAVGYIGFVATIIRVQAQTMARLGFVYTYTNFGDCWLNGTPYKREEFQVGTADRYLDVELRAGDNFFLMEVSCTDHGDGFHMGVDCEQPFEIVAPCPVGEDDSSLVTVGPFAVATYLDHQRTEDPLQPFRAYAAIRRKGGNGDEALKDEAVAAYAEAFTLASARDLTKLQAWVRPIPNRLVCPYDGFAASIWKRSSQPFPVSESLQQAVIASPDPAVVPVFEGADTEWIVDFGRELSGYLSFEVQAAAGTIIDLYGFEHKHEDWRQDTFRLDHTLRYVCREGRQAYTSPVRRGLRYLMVTVRGASMEQPVQVYGLQLRQSNYPVAEIGRFQCSDPLLNEIWRISRHTTRICMEDTFVDCPAYEQTFWVGDSRNEALINYYTFGALDIVKRCMRLVPGSRFQTPLYADQVPSGWNSVIPNWTFFWVTACAEYYLHTGDVPFAEELWPHVDYTLTHYLEYLNTDGLLDMKAWNFLDWAPLDQPNDGVVAHQNMLLTKALRDAAVLAEAAGERAAAEACRAKAERLKKAINSGLWADEREAYRDCIHADGRPSAKFSMQTQVIAQLCHVAEGARLERIVAHLDEPPADFTRIGSPFMSFFHYESMVMTGRFKAMLDDMRRHYGTMVEFDASTCWESYPSDTPPDPKNLTRSHCHAWSAAPAYFLGAWILGVRRGSPGWETIVIEPQPTGLSWASGVVPLPQGGSVELSWRADESSKTIAIRLNVPAGHQVELRAPQGYRLITERHDIVGV